MRRNSQIVAEDRARALLRALYAAVRTDDIARDYNMVSALTKPVIQLVACLANAGSSRQAGYYQRGVGFARAYVAELRAVLAAAREVGYLTTYYDDLHRQVADLDGVLLGIEGVLEARVCG
jgi:hypothetical protein